MVKMKRYFGFAIVIIAALMGLTFIGCAGTETPEGALSVSECVDNPVYDTEIKVFGEVSLLNELDCPCFQLSSDEEDILVWYDSMIEDDGTEVPSVSVEGIKNGDQVIVTGELKRAGENTSHGDFWSSSIEMY